MSKESKNIRNIWGDEGPMLFKANLLGTKLRVERYPNTVCTWHRILYLRENKEVYRITLIDTCKKTKNNEYIDTGIRKEYFFDRKFRQYQGDRFCFIEYADFWEKNKRCPLDKELDRLGLEKRIAEGYKRFAYKIAKN
jgi:hypothetical protein